MLADRIRDSLPRLLQSGNAGFKSPRFLLQKYVRITSLVNTTIFESSDSVRNAKPLPHALSVQFHDVLKLEKGDCLPQLTVVYETYGRLNAARDNAILICHALSGDSHVASHNQQDDPGWWEIAVGPGKPIDTDQLFVICP